MLSGKSCSFVTKIMALELFVTRTSRQPLDAAAKKKVEDRIASLAPRARFRVRWDWSEDGGVLNVRTTMIRWEMHFGEAEETDRLSIYADVPKFITNFFSQAKQIQFKEDVEKELDALGF